MERKNETQHCHRLQSTLADARARRSAAALMLQQIALNPGAFSDEIAERYRQDFREASGEEEYLQSELNAQSDGVENDLSEEEHISLTWLEDVHAEAVRWLWPGRIPLGKVTVLDGDPGLGKSLITLDLAARVSTARAMPDGTVSDLDGPAGVVLLSAEDDLADTIRPRLDAAGADVSCIVALTSVQEEESERLPTLLDLDEIRAAIHAVNAKLVVVDPFMAYLPGKTDSHRDQDIRRILTPVAKLAAETGVAVVVVRHLNKSEGRKALYRGGGTIGIVGAARSALIVAGDPDDSDRRILAVQKANLAREAQSLTYCIVETDRVPVVRWGGISEHTADSLLAQQVDNDERSALDDAKTFLLDVLSKGVVPAKEVQKQAEQAGISYATLRRAKAALKILALKKEGFFSRGERSQWCWCLPSAEDAQPGAKDAQTREHEHLQQSSEKNSRFFNGIAEDAQISECEHLQTVHEHLQEPREDGKVF